MNDRYVERATEPFPEFSGNDSRKVGGEAGCPQLPFGNRPTETTSLIESPSRTILSAS